MIDYAAARETMVDCQVRPSDVTKYPIIDALLTVPREEFVPASKRDVAYVGEHIELGAGRVLLDPRTFAKMLDAVNIQRDDLVLDVGCGTGYSTAVIACLAEAVVGLEENPELAAEATEYLAATGADNAMVVEGKLIEGAPKHGPYDVVFLEGAAEDIPKSLLDQLKPGGRSIAVRSEGIVGRAKVGHKHGGGVDWRAAFAASAPLLEGFGAAREFTF